MANAPVTKQQAIADAQRAMREAFDEIYSRVVAKYKLLDQGPVDDKPWYTVQIMDRDVWFWLSQQEGSWHHYRCEQRNIPLVDMEEAVYLALVMRWS